VEYTNHTPNTSVEGNYMLSFASSTCLRDCTVVFVLLMIYLHSFGVGLSILLSVSTIMKSPHTSTKLF